MQTFYKALMASENVMSYLGSAKFQANDKYAIIHDGALIKLGALAPNDAYGANVLDDNVYLATAPAAATDDVVIVDISNVSNGVIMGNNYKIGIKAVGLQMEAGYAVRYRIPMKHDRYWITDDLFNDTPAIGSYATAQAGGTLHNVVTEKPTSGYCVEIIDSRDFTVGNSAFGKMWLCEVK